MVIMKRILLFILIINAFSVNALAQKVGLKFSAIPSKWDEAIPLGNGIMGALIWQKAESLRMSLDHAELWDLRPMAELHTKGFDYKLVKEKVLANQYADIQKIGDLPYEREPAPSKLPGAALEFNVKNWGAIQSCALNIETAEATINWQNGCEMYSFVHATKPLGYFKFIGLTQLNPELFAPNYDGDLNATVGGSVAGDDLARLGYQKGEVVVKGNTLKYIQRIWGGAYYEVMVVWNRTGNTTFEGVWSITAHYPGKPVLSAFQILKNVESYDSAFKKHYTWWKKFWSKSKLTLPNQVLQNQYDLEQYKFGSVARVNFPPISLQAIWTADNGRLPPWKGDFHHDLNTQLSYWPAYSANHLNEALGYIHHLEKNKSNYKKYTRWYFGTNGLNVPGVTTLDGVEMGGWIQYSLSPTVSAWLAQHYYLQWRYSMDTNFLKRYAYPWFKEVALHLEQLTTLDANGHRQLPLSSSPEINDNNKNAWFLENTNYDLALMRFVFNKAAELAYELKKEKDAAHFRVILKQFSGYHLSDNAELKFSKELPYNESHRHFSHLMAIHPLGEICWEGGAENQKIITNSLNLLERVGPGNWCGYSYAWAGNLWARAKNGVAAERYLSDFATAFCSPNSFHLNGDQSNSGKSSFTYRPFTLEGNFAFAAGIQEMLIQSYAGFIEVFPAIPSDWLNVSFQNLRTEGAFLVSAKKQNGLVSNLEIIAEEGGKAKLKLPFTNYQIPILKDAKIIRSNNGYIQIEFQKKGEIKFLNKEIN